MNRKMITLTFFKLYTVFKKKLGQFFFQTSLLTCFNKDKSVLLKLINVLTSLKVNYENNGLNLFKNTMYMWTLSLIKL